MSASMTAMMNKVRLFLFFIWILVLGFYFTVSDSADWNPQVPETYTVTY